jgi:hypothetical protein
MSGEAPDSNADKGKQGGEEELVRRSKTNQKPPVHCELGFSSVIVQREVVALSLVYEKSGSSLCSITLLTLQNFLTHAHWAPLLGPGGKAWRFLSGFASGFAC